MGESSPQARCRHGLSLTLTQGEQVEKQNGFPAPSGCATKWTTRLPMKYVRWMILGLLAASGWIVEVRAAGPWTLVWSDEFNQPDGSPPAPTHWAFNLGGNGWGNNELQCYTARTNNARTEGGMLVIEARKEELLGKKYTSARLHSKDHWAGTYGRIEARMRIPRGQGLWPAFWMLGADFGTVRWPDCGEVDIMENIGREPGKVHGTLHGPGYSGGRGISGSVSLPTGQALADDFHVYAVEWEANRIRWFLDEKPYFTVTPADLPAGARWVFDKPHYLLLNLAVGGNWPGGPDATTTFPQRLYVDYVRVYAANPAGTSHPDAGPISGQGVNSSVRGNPDPAFSPPAGAPPK